MTGVDAARVVIADDDADIRNLIAISARRIGMQVVAEVGDGAGALAALRELVPNLAILDVAMPAMSGIEVCRAIKADAALAAIRIILLSAAADDESRAAGLAAGATDYLVKPFSPRELGARLAEYLRTTQ
jgi:DNA-binding response OmpR family regulator